MLGLLLTLYNFPKSLPPGDINVKGISISCSCKGLGSFTEVTGFIGNAFTSGFEGVMVWVFVPVTGKIEGVETSKVGATGVWGKTGWPKEATERVVREPFETIEGEPIQDL